MEWLNYHHLLYFWSVAKEGSVTKASRELSLAQPTISGQIRQLEEALGGKLFRRSGRSLALTEFGRLVYQYADEIFSLGRELTVVLQGQPGGRAIRLTVGVADVLPKQLVHRILEPVLKLNPPVRMVIVEDRTERLVAELSLQALDVVLTNVPFGPQVRVRAYNHVLGASPIGIFAPARIAAAYRQDFPQSLQGAKWLMPLEASASRRSLDQWLSANGIHAEVAAELQDSALTEVFADRLDAVFAAPVIIEEDIRQRCGCVLVNTLEGAEERFYAISVERQVKHPAVLAITQSAQQTLGAATLAPPVRTKKAVVATNLQS